MTKINYICFLNNSGYSQAAQDLILALHRSGNYDIRIHSLGNGEILSMSKERQSFFKNLTKKDITLDHINVYHCIPLIQHRVKYSSLNIGFATFETYDPPPSWIKILNEKNDMVIVPSHFNYKVFAHAGVNRPMIRIPHCLDFNLFPKKERNRNRIFTFLFFGFWKKRKGYEALLDAWFAEFDKKDHVQLVIKTDQPQKARACVIALQNNFGYKKKDIAPIIFENKVFDELTLHRIYDESDCLIAPHCGEGFGLPGLQAMATGLPVIITDFSGSQDYANEETVTLLKPEGFRLHMQMDGYPQFKQKKWAFVSASQIRRAMRNIIENYDKALEKTNKGLEFIKDEFSYENAVKQFDSILLLCQS